MIHNNILTNKSTIVTLLFLSTLISWLLGGSLSQSQIQDVDHVLTHSYQCQTSSIANKSVLRVHVPIERLAVALKAPLCTNKVVAKQYGYVELYWGGNLAEQIEFLAKGVADVVLSQLITAHTLRSNLFLRTDSISRNHYGNALRGNTLPYSSTCKSYQRHLYIQSQIFLLTLSFLF